MTSLPASLRKWKNQKRTPEFLPPSVCCPRTGRSRWGLIKVAHSDKPPPPRPGDPSHLRNTPTPHGLASVCCADLRLPRSRRGGAPGDAGHCGGKGALASRWRPGVPFTPCTAHVAARTENHPAPRLLRQSNTLAGSNFSPPAPSTQLTSPCEGAGLCERGLTSQRRDQECVHTEERPSAGESVPAKTQPAGTWIPGLSLHSRETTTLHCARLVRGVPSRQQPPHSQGLSPHSSPVLSIPLSPRPPARPAPPPSRALQPGPTSHQGCIGAAP